MMPVASQADQASHPHNTAFQRLAQFMEMKFDADSNCVMNLTDLSQKFKELLREEGVIVSSYKSHLLKSRIYCHFGDRLTFHRPRKYN